MQFGKIGPKEQVQIPLPKKKKKKKSTNKQANSLGHSSLHGVKSESETKTMGSMWMMRQVSIRVAASTNSLLLSNSIITSQFPISFSFSSYPKSQYLISLVSSSHRHSLSTTAASSSSSSSTSSHFGLSFFTIPLIFIMSETLVLVFLISNCFFFLLGDVEEIEVSKNGSNSKTLLKGLTYSEFEVMFHLSLILIILGSV